MGFVAVVSRFLDLNIPFTTKSIFGVVAVVENTVICHYPSSPVLLSGWILNQLEDWNETVERCGMNRFGLLIHVGIVKWWLGEWFATLENKHIRMENQFLFGKNKLSSAILNRTQHFRNLYISAKSLALKFFELNLFA